MITMVIIDGVNISTQYGFYLAQRQLSAPAVKEEYIDIPASNGEFDATDAFGEVFYKNRELVLDMIYPGRDFDDDLSALVNYLHGKKRKIVFSADPDWYYVGRLSIGNYDSSSHRLSVSASVFPYKLAVEETVVTSAVSGSTSVTLENDAMTVVPVVTNSAEMTLTWGSGNSKTISAGTHQIAGLELLEGNTTVGVSGSGNITFTYRKGRL